MYIFKHSGFWGGGGVSVCFSQGESDLEYNQFKNSTRKHCAHIPGLNKYSNSNNNQT